MGFVPLPINQPLYQNLDESSQSNTSPERHDVFMDESGSMVRRPGLEEFVEVGTGPINGLYYWYEKDKLYIVSGKDLYSMTEGGTTALIESDLFNIDTRVIWDEAINPSRKIFGTNGGIPVEYDGATAQKLTDANAPQLATHLAIFDTYLIANQTGTQKIEYSNVGQPTVFSAEFAVAEAQSDDIVFVGIGWDEIVAIGKKTQEFFYDDGSTPFMTKPGAIVQEGCIAPYSVKLIDNAWFFLNHERRVMRLNGRQPVVLSIPVDKVLSGLTNVTDAIGDELTVGGRGFYVLTFPTDNKTIVYDYVNNQWCGEWGSWDTLRSKYKRWRGNCITYVPEWNVHLVGDYVNNKIYKASLTQYQDGTDTIRSAWLTGNIDHGTSLWKRSLRLRLRIKRGEGDITDDEAPVLMLRWRDNGNKAWKNTLHIDLGQAGEYDFYKEIGPLGRYRSRQYEISITDDIPLTLVSVEENVLGGEDA